MRLAEHPRERPAWWALAAAALASFILHLPFLTTPLSVDEGGYGYVARWWAAGADLYGDVWVDRPQGLLLLYRWAEALPGSDRLDIRLMAAVWSSAIAIVLGLLVTNLAGRRAGAAAAPARRPARFVTSSPSTTAIAQDHSAAMRRMSSRSEPGSASAQR